MKILHTADIHLKAVDDERWKALVGLIEMAKKEHVDVFAVSGDLFNSGADAERIRAEMRELFENNPYKILLLPGNHDQDVYESGKYFGDDAVVLNNPGTPFSLQDVCFWGLPYTSAGTEEILRTIHSFKKLLDTGKTHILLYHGELLDSFFSRIDFGEEGAQRYMPVRLSYFDGLDFTYVLAGHFHTRFDIRVLPNGGYFVYPGSPISISSKETGRRKVNIFEVGKPPGGREVDTPYYEEALIRLSPFDAQRPLERIEGVLDAMGPGQNVLLTVGGYFNGEKDDVNETQLTEEIRRLIRGKPVTFTPLYMDIRSVLEDDLFSMFLEKLEGRGLGEEKKAQLYYTVVQAMISANLKKQGQG